MVVFQVHDLEDQRSKLEGSSSYQIDNLKTAFNTQLNILHQENSDLKIIIDNKDKDIQDLLEKYTMSMKYVSGIKVWIRPSKLDHLAPK